MTHITLAVDKAGSPNETNGTYRTANMAQKDEVVMTHMIYAAASASGHFFY